MMNKQQFEFYVKKLTNEILNENSSLISIDSIISSKINYINKEIEDKVSDLEKLKEFYLEKIKIVKRNFPKLEQILRSNGFEIEKISNVGKTGLYGEKLKDDDNLNVHLRLKMIGKRKPIVSVGYTKSGAGKGQRRQSELADKMKKIIESEIKEITFNINLFSLDKPNDILADIWV